jgi:circadian clock protein KaiC
MSKAKMTEHARATERLSSGVRGLDRLLGGGLLEHGVYIIEGPPGSGKTILGNQMCHHHAGRGEQAIYFTVLAESHEKMIAHLRGLSFFRAGLVPDHLYYLSVFKVLEAEGLAGLLRLLREAVVARKASLLVMDGLATAIELSPSAAEYRKFVHELQSVAALLGCTIILLCSVEGEATQRTDHTMVDGIIELRDELSRGRAARRLRVRKLRGSDPVRGQHSLLISEDGVSVRPRIEAQLLRPAEYASIDAEQGRAHFGIPELDRMSCGGLPVNSVSMLMGASGTGKTTLALQFLAAGAERGELGVFFGFYERPAALLAKGRRIGLALDAFVAQGLLSFCWHAPSEGELDVLGERLLQVVREQRPKRLCLDSLQGLERAAEFPDQLVDVFAALAEELAAAGVTTLFTLEAPELFGPVIRSPMPGLSAISDNIILLRHAELNAHLYRSISIMKLRDSDFDSAIRELRIQSTGVAVANTFDAAEHILSGSARQAYGAAVHRDLAHPAPVSTSRHTAAGVPKQSILIVDDEFGFADLIAEILTEHEYRTSIAINGELGLLALDQDRPDLVLLDVMMPVLDGTEMLRRMKNDPELESIPVVLMTALPDAVPPDLRGAYQALLHKPFSAETLFDAMRGALGTQSQVTQS